MRNEDLAPLFSPSGYDDGDREGHRGTEGAPADGLCAVAREGIEKLTAAYRDAEHGPAAVALANQRFKREVLPALREALRDQAARKGFRASV